MSRIKVTLWFNNPAEIISDEDEFPFVAVSPLTQEVSCGETKEQALI